MLSFTRLALLSFCQQQQSHLLSRKTSKHSSATKFLFSTASFLSAASSSATLTLTSTSSLLTTTHCSALNDDNMSQSDDDESKNKNFFNTGYLNAKNAYELDQELFSTGYTLEQLMELAGLAVAEAIYDISPPLTVQLPQSSISRTEGPNGMKSQSQEKKKKSVLIICGPGNNGGDGLVAARHLVMFGYDAIVVYPKRSIREPHYAKLVQQCEDVGVKIYNTIPNNESNDGETRTYDVIVDAIFGFSFKGEAREPFATIINNMISLQKQQNIPIVAVDVPSGWNVDEGDVAQTGMIPDVLISLTAPKLCSKEFNGRHFVGGRFLPPNIAMKYGIQMPPYPGVRQVMEISSGTSNSNQEDHGNEDWALQYASYCAEKERNEFESYKNDAGIINKNENEEEDWALQYHNYCIEKEARLKEKEESQAKMKSEGQDEDWAKDYAEYLSQKEKGT